MARLFSLDVDKEELPSFLPAGWWHNPGKRFEELKVPTYVQDSLSTCVDYTALADALANQQHAQ